MNNSEFLELLGGIDEQLVRDRHTKIRFAFVVWNEGATQPAFCGSNDADMPRTLNMMIRAREFILAAEHGASFNA